MNIQDHIGEDVTNNCLLPFLSKYVVNRNGKLITRIQDIETRFKKLSEVLEKSAFYLVKWNNSHERWAKLLLKNQTTKNTIHGPRTIIVYYAFEVDSVDGDTTIYHNKELKWVRETRLSDGRKCRREVTNFVKIPPKRLDKNYAPVEAIFFTSCSYLHR